jgi:hypothetical protein
VSHLPLFLLTPWFSLSLLHVCARPS